jgi:erythrocyte band 7 integral membrane protein
VLKSSTTPLASVCIFHIYYITTNPPPPTIADSDHRSIMSDSIKPTPPSAPNSGFATSNGPAPSHTTDSPLISVQPVRHGELQPSYAQNLGVREDDAGDGIYGAFIDALGSCLGCLGAIPCCIVCPNPYKPVSQGNVGLVTKFGRFYRAVDPGLVKINPLSEKLIQIDVKIQICEVPQQVCMTKDNVTLNLTSVIYYHIVSPHKAAFGISNVRQALIEVGNSLRVLAGPRN